MIRRSVVFFGGRKEENDVYYFHHPMAKSREGRPKGPPRQERQPKADPESGKEKKEPAPAFVERGPLVDTPEFKTLQAELAHVHGVELSTGAVYYGELKDPNTKPPVPEGRGILIEKKGRVRYVGGWRGGEFFGQGTLLRATGSILRCQFNNDGFPFGIGSIQFSDGEEVNGEFDPAQRDKIRLSKDGPFVDLAAWEQEVAAKKISVAVFDQYHTFVASLDDGSGRVSPAALGSKGEAPAASPGEVRPEPPPPPPPERGLSGVEIDDPVVPLSEGVDRVVVSEKKAVLKHDLGHGIKPDINPYDPASLYAAAALRLELERDIARGGSGALEKVDLLSELKRRVQNCARREAFLERAPAEPVIDRMRGVGFDDWLREIDEHLRPTKDSRADFEEELLLARMEYDSWLFTPLRAHESLPFPNGVAQWEALLRQKTDLVADMSEDDPTKRDRAKRLLNRLAEGIRASIQEEMERNPAGPEWSFMLAECRTHGFTDEVATVLPPNEEKISEPTIQRLVVNMHHAIDHYLRSGESGIRLPGALDLKHEEDSVAIRRVYQSLYDALGSTDKDQPNKRYEAEQKFDIFLRMVRQRDTELEEMARDAGETHDVAMWEKTGLEQNITFFRLVESLPEAERQSPYLRGMVGTPEGPPFVEPVAIGFDGWGEDARAAWRRRIDYIGYMSQKRFSHIEQTVTEIMEKLMRESEREATTRTQPLPLGGDAASYRAIVWQMVVAYDARVAGTITDTPPFGDNKPITRPPSALKQAWSSLQHLRLPLSRVKRVAIMAATSPEQAAFVHESMYIDTDGFDPEMPETILVAEIVKQLAQKEIIAAEERVKQRLASSATSERLSP